MGSYSPNRVSCDLVVGHHPTMTKYIGGNLDLVQHCLVSVLKTCTFSGDWSIFYGTGTSWTSDDVNIISANNRKFASLCEYSEIDDDDDMLLNHVNSSYYDIDQLNSSKIDVPSSFGLFHVNIASLNFHADDLMHILSLLNYRFWLYLGISFQNAKM